MQFEIGLLPKSKGDKINSQHDLAARAQVTEYLIFRIICYM